MSGVDLSGLNAGYVAQMLEAYLDAPASVSQEWRDLFERDPAAFAGSLPGLAGLMQQDGTNGATAAPAAAPPTEAPAPAPAAGAAAPPAAEPVAVPAPPPAGPAAPAAAASPAAAEPARAREPAATAVDENLLGGVAAAMALVKAYRMHGHLAARLDPLGSEPMGDPALDESRLVPSLTPELQSRIPASLLRLYVEGDTLLEALPLLRAVYTGSIAYEIEHISDHAERVWLRQAIESGRFRQPLDPAERKALLHRLSEAEGFEQYLRRSFLGQKQFSLEGLESLVPMLDETIGLAAAGGAHEVVIGMAHRGRLNALVHTVGRSYQSILREFEGERSLDALVVDPEGGTGDVKYHLPASGTRVTPAGEIDVTIVPNPSHLEAADPVVEGRARAEQTDRSVGAGIHDPSVALPVLIHGDAAFPGQGVVAETLNLQSLEGYATGGTLHLITNNQVGYTTDPAESRSTRYSSDLAKGFDVPIVHVNADDPEAALSAVRLALAYRTEFGHDFVIDLVGYRRFGHNEQDDASYTQPLMVERIQRQPTVRAVYAARLVEEGAITADEAEALVAEVTATLRAAHEQLRKAIGTRHASSRCRARACRADDDGRRGRDRRRGRQAASAERAAADRARTSSRSTPSWPSSSSAATRRSPTAASTGGRAKPLPTRRCSRTGSRCGSPARTPSAAPSPIATSCSTIRTPVRRTRRSSTCRRPTRPSRSTTHRSRSTPRSGSSTATRSRRPTRSSSGRRSSATSSTALRS